MTRQLCSFILCALASVTLADIPGTCTTKKWREGTIIKVQSSQQHGVRLRFPAEVDGLTMRSALWDYDFLNERHSIAIVPISDELNGRSTTVQVWDVNGMIYDVAATRTRADSHSICVNIVDMDAEKRPRRLPRRVEIAQQVEQAVAQTRTDSNRQAEETIKDLRRFFKGSYVFKPRKNPCVSDVHSDRRITYVTIAARCSDALVVGEVKGEETPLQTVWRPFRTANTNADGNIEVPGYHDALIVMHGEQKIEIERYTNN